MATPQEKAVLIHRRHKREIAAIVKATAGDPEVLAESVSIMAIFTAGRLFGMAQTLDVTEVK